MFDYNETVNALMKDGALIGKLEGATVVLRRSVTAQQRRKLREYLINSGYAVEKVVVREVDDTGEVSVGVVSAMPEMDPLRGDKTPAVVEWYRDHEPEEYVRRYKGRRTHLGVVG